MLVAHPSGMRPSVVQLFGPLHCVRNVRNLLNGDLPIAVVVPHGAAVFSSREDSSVHKKTAPKGGCSLGG